MVLTVLTSCNTAEFIRDFMPEKSFTVKMKAIKSNQEFEADIICNNSEDITISFTYPKELSGFSVKTSENGYTVNAFGVPDEISQTELNDSSLLNVLIKSLQLSVFSNHGLFTKTDDGYEANITVDSIPVFVSFGKNGYIRTLKADTLSFSAQFEYFS